MTFFMTLWTGNGAILTSFSPWQLKKKMKINNLWTELLNFQNSFNYH